MSIEKVLRPMLVMSKIFGLAPFSFSESSHLQRIFKIVHSSFFLAAIFVTNWMYQQRYSSEYIFRYTLWGRVYGNMVIITLCYICAFIFKDKIKEAILSISAFDKKIRTLTNKYEKTCKKEFMMITVGIITLGSIILIELCIFLRCRIRQDANPDFWSEAALLLKYNCSKLGAIVMIQAKTLFYCIWDRYRLLNDVLENMFLNYKNRKNRNRKRIMIVHNIYLSQRDDEVFALLEKLLVIKDLHNQLAKISKTINHCYSFQILLNIIKAIIKITTLTFFFIHCLIMGGVCGTGLKINLDYILLVAFMLMANFLALYPLMYVASRTSSEANKTRSLLFKHMSYIGETCAVKSPCMENFKFEVQIFSLKLYHENLKFTVWNLFDLNDTLILEIIGAMTAYIIVILQFYLLFQSDKKQN